MSSVITATVLDDLAALQRGDPSHMLANVEGAGDQVRQALRDCADVDLSAVLALGPPRAVVVAGMGGSGIAGHVLQAVAGPECEVPVERVRGWSLPAWVGAQDLVIAVSSSGRTAETIACLHEALARGARVIVVASGGSPMAQVAAAHDLAWYPVPDGRPPRANVWALSVPLLVASHALGIVPASPSQLDAVGALLDDVTARCGPAVPTVTNPAKQLARALLGSFAMIWGTSDLAGIAAYRFMCQLAENAKVASVNGVLPEALHNQVVAFDGVRDGGQQAPLHVVVMRDSVEHPNLAPMAGLVSELADSRGIPTSTVTAVGTHPLQRMASLVAVSDYASVYLGLLRGVDPTPIVAIDTLKRAVAGATVRA